MNIENDSIIICNNSYKNQILKSINKLINIKFYTMDEFKKKYIFDYDYNTILYIINKYNVKYSIALLYINNLYYIENNDYEYGRLKFLFELKNDLLEHNLLIIDNHFRKSISNKSIIIYNHNLSKFDKYILKNLDYRVINTKNEKYCHTVYEALTIEDEVDFVAHSISKLLDDGISIDKIKLVNVSDDYIKVIDKIFGFYNLKINKHVSIPIISSVVGKIFYDNLSLGVEGAIKSISKYDKTDTYNKIINICNKYALVSNNKDLFTLIEYDLKNTYIEHDKYSNEIEVCDLLNYDFNGFYVFLLGFNLGSIPLIYRDEDFIPDKYKLDYMDTTIDKNKLSKKNVVESIENIKNLVITYKLKTDFEEFYPSNLIEEKVVRINKDYKKSYSSDLDKLNYALYLDELVKYNVVNSNLSILSNNYDIPYNTYNNLFTGINTLKIKKYINSLKRFNLSYTMMDNYNRCSFRFYVNKILCLNKDIDKFSIELGNIYHYALQKYFTNKEEVSDSVNEYISKNNLSLKNSDRFFIDRAIKNIEYVISVIEYQNSFSSFENIDTEEFISVPISDNINFVGFIDKIIYKTIDDYILATIIDYKTYVKKPSLKYIDSGIDIQLPVYMFLAKEKYKNIRFTGFYLQNVSDNNLSKEEKLKSLKLIGYTNKDTSILEKFDYNYKDSKVIDGIKVKNDGTLSSNSLKKMMSDDEINNIIKKVKDIIDITIDNILKCNFDINPKFDIKNIGCEFCEYNDLCFKKNYNFKTIKGNDKYEGD